MTRSFRRSAVLVFFSALSAYHFVSAQTNEAVPVRIAGVDYNFSPATNQLVGPGDKAIPEAASFSHSWAIGFNLGDHVARFYIPSREKSDRKDDPAYRRKMANHEIEALTALSQGESPLAIKVLESGEAGVPGQGTLYSVLQVPKNFHHVEDLVKKDNYSQFDSHVRALAHALFKNGWDIGVKASQFIIDLDGPEPRARLMRVFSNDKKTEGSAITLAGEYAVRLDRLAAWPEVHKNYVAAKEVPDLRPGDFGNTPGEVARIIAQSLRVGKPIWVDDQKPIRRGNSVKFQGKTRIRPVDTEFTRKYLLEGYFEADVYTSDGKNVSGDPVKFRLEHLPRVSVQEPRGEGDAAVWPEGKSSISAHEAAPSISRQKLAARAQAHKELKKKSLIRRNQVFRFRKEDDPMEVINLAIRLTNTAEVRFIYHAGRPATEKAKKEAEPAIEAGIPPQQFTGRITSVTRNKGSHEWTINILTNERVGTGSDGKIKFLTRTINPWVGYAEEMRIINTKLQKISKDGKR